MAAEKSRALPNSWILQTFFCTSFFLQSFALQTEIAMGVSLNFIMAVVIFPAGFLVCSVSLFYNKVPQAYEMLPTEDPDEEAIQFVSDLPKSSRTLPKVSI